MHIAQIAPLYQPVPAKFYGSVERLISMLTEELVRRDHDVTLFASGDSVTTARLEPMNHNALWHPRDNWPDPTAARFQMLAMLSDVYSRADEFDVIHSHVDIYTLPFARLAACPTIITLYGRLDLDYLPAIYQRFPGARLVSISLAQRAPLAHLDLDWIGHVPGGIPIDSYRYYPEPGSYLAFVGRITPVKRPDLAVQVARDNGLPLKVAGVITPRDYSYWTDAIRPLFQENGVDFIGEISDEDKPEFYGAALATLFPSDWPESFGLVVLESLACGTPVVALDRGAIREIICDGVHGFICPDSDAMTQAVGRIGDIERAACRQRSLQFRSENMVRAYEEIYRSALAGA